MMPWAARPRVRTSTGCACSTPRRWGGELQRLDPKPDPLTYHDGDEERIARDCGFTTADYQEVRGAIEDISAAESLQARLRGERRQSPPCGRALAAHPR